MLPKIALATFVCCLAVATAYYDNAEYGYGYDYDGYGADDEYGAGRYDNDYQYEAQNSHHDDHPVYGGRDGLSYGSTEAYDEQPRYRNSRRNGYRASRYNGRRSSYGSYGSYDEHDDGYGYDDQDYAPKRYGRRRGGMDRYGRSGTYGYAKPKHNVPVIIKKKKEKKRKTIAVHSGFYIPGGTAIFGKFKDLKSCQKACELTPTCFAGDFNPWLNKCYMHSNITACQSMRSHKQITHFKKVPCNVVETPRGLITLGAASWYGVQQKHIETLMECIKGCATAGGGIAATPDVALQSPQLCFGITYDFADHKCFFHVDIAICGGNMDTAATPVTPVTLYAQASAVNILICPIAPMG